jgi:hypothetical protein
MADRNKALREGTAILAAALAVYPSGLADARKKRPEKQSLRPQGPLPIV